MTEDFDNWYSLLAAVVKQAIREAKQGKRSAEYWLDFVCPNWRERVDLEIRHYRKPEKT